MQQVRRTLSHESHYALLTMEKLHIQDLDPRFPDELAQEPGCQHLRRCFSCGICTATCPVSVIEPSFSPSRILRQILCGMRTELLASPALWYCLSCARCSFQCPQDVRFLDIIQGLRHLAVREGAVNSELPERLRQGEVLLQEVRRRLIARLMAHPVQEEDLASLLADVVKDLKTVEQA
ncbi:MAG TPA: hypothetical protein DCY27_11235 [Desulfobacterales bacterium]|nr:hypothetical protein [Desulfobacterales bacterium]